MSMRVVLCGAKGAGKSELLKALEAPNIKKWEAGEYAPTLVPNQLDGKYGDWTLDRLADYRVELQLALDRATDQEQEGIFESSLIDSVAYAATRLSYIINDGIGTDDDQARWEIVVHASARMLRDSVLPDAIIYVPGSDEEPFYEELEDALVATVWELIPDQVAKYKLLETDTLQRAEEVATILERFNEQRDNPTESDGEDN